MIQTTFDVTPEELFRLLAAYVAIRCPKARGEFLWSIEAWCRDQFAAGDKALETDS